MNYRTSALVLIIVAGLCVYTSRASAQADQTRRDEPHRFEGIEITGLPLNDRMVPLFGTAAPESALKRPASVSQDEILASVAAEGDGLRTGMNLATVLMGTKAFMSFKVKGKEADAMLLVTVHPQKESARGNIFFTPGRVTRLAAALETFGQPTETQLWSSKPAKNLGLDGSVYWWGEVGVSASPDGAITHVLLRKVIQRE